MKIALDIDEKILDRARHITGISSGSELVQEALKALIERESAQKLAKSGGSQPGLQSIPRRRFDSCSD